MSEIAQAALANVGATEANLSDGQSRGKGAPAAPLVEQAPKPETPAEKEAPKDKVKTEQEPGKEAQEVETTEEGAEEEELAPVTDYVDMQDENLNAVSSLLKDAGLSPAEAEVFFGEAVASQDPSKIDWKGLAEKVGGAKAHAMRSLVERYAEQAQADNAANAVLVADVHKMYGGEQGFKTVAEWARQKEKRDPAFAEILNDIRYDIQNGSPRAVKAAARELLDLYNRAPNTKGLGNKNIVAGDGKAKSDQSPLDRGTYLDLLKKANEKGDHAEIARLNARRLAGKKAGI